MATDLQRAGAPRPNELAPDLIALAGDIVDGPVPRLARHVAPLAELAQGGRAFLVLGNHDYYAGAGPWVAQFESMGLRVLRNSQISVARGAARLIVGGVIDPAARAVDIEARPRPDLASAIDAGVAFRLLLAHNPKIVPLAESAGFDLQLSGHTHAGQFFPRTIAFPLRHTSPGFRVGAHVGLCERGNRHAGPTRALRHRAGADGPASRARHARSTRRHRTWQSP